MIEKKKGNPVELVFAKPKVKPPISMTEEIFDEVIEWVSSGNTLRAFCRQPNRPNWTTIYDYINKSDERVTKFARARRACVDAIAEDTIQMVDEYPERIQDDRIDPGWVNWRRIQVEQRLKLIAKWDPIRYGEKINVDHAGGVSLNVVTGVPSELPDETLKLPE